MATAPETGSPPTSDGTKSASREPLAFALVLALLVGGFFHETLIGGKILSPADVLLVEAGFQAHQGPDYEPANRLLMDPVLQFQPWLELNRSQIRQGRLPLWNPYAGCGVPHLANGQSAVFDPFNLIAYVWNIPDALVWMAAARLWVAGFGMFLLARSWNFGIWGRWFAGLVFPFSGFLVAWLLYPVTPAAIWMPWLFLASDRALRGPGGVSVAFVAVVSALIIFGGHIQTGAHVLLAAGLFVLWRLQSSGIGLLRGAPALSAEGWEPIPGSDASKPRPLPSHAESRSRSPRLGAVEWKIGSGILTWGLGIVLGIGLAAVQLLPFADYLAKSPVWADRQRELNPWWQLSKPRIPDILCTTLPYIYGSQRREHPNLARAVGAHNLNESSGGFTGFPNLLLLVPLAWKVRRPRQKGEEAESSDDRIVASFLFILATVGFLASFRLPPIDNLLRLLPILNVTDNRRLSLWMAFSFSLLGGIGMDALRSGAILGTRWIGSMILVAVSLLTGASAIIASEPMLRRSAEAHYREAAIRRSEADPEGYRRLADRRVRAAVAFLPRYYAETACGLLIMAGLLSAARRRPGPNRWIPAAVLLLTLVDLGRFGMGLNPAIQRELQTFEPPAITYLRRELKAGERAIGIGEELPPNVLMRFGLRDPRNYDSIELSRNLEWLAPLFDDESSRVEARTSRRKIDWQSVARARKRLEEAGVAAVVGASAPPPGMFEKVKQVGEVWISHLDAMPFASWASGRGDVDFTRDFSQIRIIAKADQTSRIIIRETWDDGWNATIDGTSIPISAYANTFIEITVPSGTHSIILAFSPRVIRTGKAISTLSGFVILGILGLTRIRRY